MRPLYQISTEYRQVLSEIEHSDSIDHELLERLDNVSSDLDQKIINIAAVIKNLELEEEALHNTISELHYRKTKIEKKISSLRDLIENEMNHFNIKQIKSPLFDVKYYYNPPAVKVYNEDILPTKYKIQKLTEKVDITRISIDLKNELEVPGATLERKKRLVIE